MEEAIEMTGPADNDNEICCWVAISKTGIDRHGAN
jgi:hypothetical protein